MVKNFKNTKKYILKEIRLLNQKLMNFIDDEKQTNKKLKQYNSIVKKLKQEIKILQTALKILKSRVYE